VGQFAHEISSICQEAHVTSAPWRTTATTRLRKGRNAVGKSTQRRPCSVDGCDGVTGPPGTARGWCSVHYQKWYNHGDHLYVRHVASDDTCSVESCDEPGKTRGWCAKHYWLALTYGDPLYAKETYCNVEDCVGLRVSRGWCAKHYAKWRDHGDPLYVKAAVDPVLCSIEGCDRVQSARTYCRNHYETNRKHGDPLYVYVPTLVNEGSCTIDGCDHPRSARGWCKMHYTRYRTHGDAEYVKERAPRVECSVDDCDRLAGGSGSGRGMCSKHYQREWTLKRSYAISVKEFESMLAAQGGVCLGCGTNSPGEGFSQWHVDHDHKTNVVRGILCGTCNWALGNTRDRPATLRRLAAYLESPRVLSLSLEEVSDPNS
jgi:hypothetical protein